MFICMWMLIDTAGTCRLDEIDLTQTILCPHSPELAKANWKNTSMQLTNLNIDRIEAVE